MKRVYLNYNILSRLLVYDKSTDIKTTGDCSPAAVIQLTIKLLLMINY